MLVEKLLGEPEVIGPPDCPIIYRWTLVQTRWGKVMLHRFPANADDRDVHDHPWPFVTAVLRGGYDDFVMCPRCRGTELADDPVPIPTAEDPDATALTLIPCPECVTPGRGPTGMVLGRRMRAGTVAYRPATHVHRTRAGERGAWTLVVTGPVVRRWGFWRGGQWIWWKSYEEKYGFAMRCEDLDREYRR